MKIEEFIEILASSKEIIDWKLLDFRKDGPAVVFGTGTDRTSSKQKFGILYEGVKGKTFNPISAVYYLLSGKFINPPNYFYSSQSYSGHKNVNSALGMNNDFARRIDVACLNWTDSVYYREGDREKIFDALSLKEEECKT